LVTDDPNVIFYAGVPLISETGYPLGTLCVIDNTPRELDVEQIKALKYLANQVSRLMEKRKQQQKLMMLVKELENKNSNLNDFVKVAAHDLKSPLHCITMLSDLVRTEHCNQLDKNGLEMISLIRNASIELSELIDGIMKYSLDASLIIKDKETINIRLLLESVIGMVDPSNSVVFNLNFSDSEQIFTNKTALEQIFINILSNSIKYNDKDVTIIDVSYKIEGEFVIFNIQDNGPGIKEEDRERIFEIFQTASKSDKYGKKGSGIGLATVKSLVSVLNGNIEVIPSVNQGLTTVIKLRN
jgi:hypothetical protein